MKRREICAAGASALLLASPSLAAAAQEHGAEAGGGPGLFDINFGLSFWTVVVFLVLLWVLKRYAWGPILDAVEAREDRIHQALEEASRQRGEARKLLEKQREELAEARRRAQEIIAEGREAGQGVRREIEEKAREESEKILARARREIEREKDSALDALRRESVELALAAASRLLGQRLDAERDRELVLEYVERLGDEEREARA